MNPQRHLIAIDWLQAKDALCLISGMAGLYALTSACPQT